MTPIQVIRNDKTMAQDYQEIISKVSKEVAKKFLKKETNLAARAILLDADISEITRQIGLETTKIVFEHVRDNLVKKNKKRIRHPKPSKHLLQRYVRDNNHQFSLFMEETCWRETVTE